jgi:hypothetical protein
MFVSKVVVLIALIPMKVKIRSMISAITKATPFLFLRISLSIQPLLNSNQRHLKFPLTLPLSPAGRGWR